MNDYSETKTAAASYILTFYETVQYLSQISVNYANYVEELSYRYLGEMPEGGIDETEAETFKKLVRDVKKYVRQSFLQYKSIQASAEFEENKLLEKTYKNLCAEFPVKKEDVEKYTLEINKVLTAEIIKDLLTTSQDIIDDIFT